MTSMKTIQETRLETLEDLFKEELKDIYSAETQMLKALPKMIAGAESDELRAAFENHLEITREHPKRIEKIMSELDASPAGKKCGGMEGLLKEGDEMLKMKGEPAVIDAGLIGAAKRVEHYEIAAYATARAHAIELGMDEAADLLLQSLTEEEEADETLSAIAERGVNAGADSEDPDSEDEVEAVGSGRTVSTSSSSTGASRSANNKKK
ncbi:MAG: ferritin-like domain-containing protein [Candidatus Eisenbacteria bacterium]|nr:ferritin-like domain-containing protein [Candidatus Eisenbacteria bacterium]